MMYPQDFRPELDDFDIDVETLFDLISVSSYSSSNYDDDDDIDDFHIENYTKQSQNFNLEIQSNEELSNGTETVPEMELENIQSELPTPQLPEIREDDSRALESCENEIQTVSIIVEEIYSLKQITNSLESQLQSVRRTVEERFELIENMINTQKTTYLKPNANCYKPATNFSKLFGCTQSKIKSSKHKTWFSLLTKIQFQLFIASVVIAMCCYLLFAYSNVSSGGPKISDKCRNVTALMCNSKIPF